MEKVRASVYGAARAIHEKLVAPPTVSCFREKGCLTPDEFVEAGDELVFKFKSWKW